MTFWNHIKQTLGDFFDAPLKLSRPLVMGGSIIYALDVPIYNALIAHNHSVIAAIVVIAALPVGMIAGWKEASYCVKWGNRRRIVSLLSGEEL